MSDEKKKSYREALTLFGRLSVEEQNWRTVRQQIPELYADALKAQQSLEEKEGQERALDEAIRLKESRLADLDAAIKDRQAKLARVETTIQEKARAEEQRLRADRDARLAAADAEIEQKERRLRRLKEVAEQEGL